MKNVPILNAIKYFKLNSKALDNYQTMYGITVEVYRIKDRINNAYINAYGVEKINFQGEQYLEKYKDIIILSTPQNLYDLYATGDSLEDKRIYLSTNELVQGDIIRYMWVDEQVLEFSISGLPQTFGGIYYGYPIVSLYQKSYINIK